MTHTIAVDDVTYDTLRTGAEENGRTLVGQLRWLLGVQKPIEKKQNYVINGDAEPRPSNQAELQQLLDRLQYFDEDTPEYQETLSRIKKFQK